MLKDGRKLGMNETQVRKRNFYALILEGTFFFSGLAFIDVNAVIPVFIYTYTQSLKLAGLATTINLAASVITQILLGPYVKSIRNMPRYMTTIMFIFRPLPLLMIPVLFSSWNPMLIVTVFLILYALLFFGDGLILVPWTDMFGRTILPEKRGKVLGLQQLFGGIGSLAAGFIIKSVLENTAFSDATRYSIIFSSASILMLLSSAAMLLTKDLPRPIESKPAKNRHYYASLPAYLKKNKDFRRVALIRILSSFTSMVAPFLILFGQNIFRLDVSQVSTLIYIQIAGGLLGGVIWSQISSRFGNKFVILTAQVTGLLIPIAALACFLVRDLSLPWYLLWPIILANGTNMGSWVGTFNYLIDIIDEEERTIYLLLSSVITFPLTGLAFLAGILADQTGFVPLFIISIVTACLGIFLARGLKSRRQL